MSGNSEDGEGCRNAISLQPTYRALKKLFQIHNKDNYNLNSKWVIAVRLMRVIQVFGFTQTTQ